MASDEEVLAYIRSRGVIYDDEAKAILAEAKRRLERGAAE